VTKQHLLAAGFQFKYLTHTYKNKKGNVYFFCYDHGYLELGADWLLLVRVKEKMHTHKSASVSILDPFCLTFRKIAFTMDLDIPPFLIVAWQVFSGISLAFFILA